MRSDIFHEALMATARVACCAALVGCVPTKSPHDTSLVDSDADTDSDSELDPVEECMGVIDEECCQTVAEHFDEQDLEGMESWQDRDECCELLEWQGSLACTPWGPPCPPAMA